MLVNNPNNALKDIATKNVDMFESTENKIIIFF